MELLPKVKVAIDPFRVPSELTQFKTFDLNTGFLAEWYTVAGLRGLHSPGLVRT